MPRSDTAKATAAEAENLAASKTLGGRHPRGAVGVLLFLVALAWPLFQLFVTSPLPFLLGRDFVLDYSQTRLAFYSFAIFLVFCGYPATARGPRDRIPWYDWVLACAGAATSLYVFVLYEQVAMRSGAPLARDVAVAAVGILILFEATRRAVGIPLTVVVMGFIAYAFLGEYMPEFIAHRTPSIARVADHMWLSNEGVFGLPLGVATDFVFLFVLFGALLERAGAGTWFMQTSFALLGHQRGGPAKASVVSSAMFGMISGSALANVVTTGNFTIPLMKKSGFPAEKAAAIESSSSINGQVMPPVMGAVAFLMMEFVGITYLEVITHAFLPAFISYAGLYYIVHLEAIKLGLEPLPRRVERSMLSRIGRAGFSFLAAFAVAGAIYSTLRFVRATWPEESFLLVVSMFLAVYLALLWVASRVPELELSAPDKPLTSLPDTVPTLLAGLHHLLPVAVLIWCLIVERFSPSLSIYWSILSIVFIIVTQPLILTFLRGRTDYAAASRRAAVDVVDGMVTGARNMVGIAVTMAAAGIIVGGVSLTGIGLVLVTVIDILSGGNLLAMLLITAVVTIVLGMGLSSTANYLVVAVLMAPVVTVLAAQSGLLIPLVAVHFFVFYCALVSGNTPPVALDAYVAAGMANADPWRTCLQAFYYTMRTMILPFIFVFNTELLLIGVESWTRGVLVGVVSLVAMLLFVAACQGHLLVRSRRYESALLLLIAFTLVRPGFWLDRVYPPFEQVDPLRIEQFAERQPPNAHVRLRVEGRTFSGREVQKVVVLPLGPAGRSGAERLDRSAGLTVVVENGGVVVDNVRFDGPAQREGMDFDWRIRTLEVPVERPDKAWLYIPAFLLLAVVLWLQSARGPASLPSPAATGTSGPPRRGEGDLSDARPIARRQ